MNKRFILMAMAAGLILGANAQEKVDQYLKVSDSNFIVGNYQDANNPNSSNAVKNSFTIPTAFGSVAWSFGSLNWWDPGVDMSGFDKLVIRLKSVAGNNLQFRIFDFDGAGGKKTEYKLPDDIVVSPEEVEYEVDLKEDLYSTEGVLLDKTNIKSFVFWNYWATELVYDEDGNPVYVYDEDGNLKYNEDGTPMQKQDDDPTATVTIGAMYLERTLANGEKDYVDLLADKKMSFSDAYLDEDEDPDTKASYVDNTNMMYLQENATGGITYDETPADWSGYKYLVIVPQIPASDATPVVDYTMTDEDDNAFCAGSFRYGTWNRTRAGVQDLTALLTTKLHDSTDDAPEYLTEFNTSKIFDFHYSLWGGVSAWQFGVAGMYLSNTPPTYSTGFGTGTDNTGDYVRDNAAETAISTVCLPFASACCGAQVYELSGVDSKGEPTEVYAAPHTGILEAGKPYIIRSNTARNITFFRAGANELSEPVVNGALEASSFNTYYVEADKNNCVLNADGTTFEAITGKSKRVNSNTAFLNLANLPEGTEVENGLVFAITGADGAAGISTVNVSANPQKDNKIYNISGCEVAQPTQKGLYIMNGKKFIVK